MLFGNRKVRSAGRTSGSVEITLPAKMQVLQGVECRLILRDGARPEIVLQPDVSMAESIFADLWKRLGIAFAQIGDIGEFSLADFEVGLLPPRYWRDKPPLSYEDALAVHRARANGRPYRPGGGVNHLITFLSVGAAYRLGLESRFALVFGVVVGYLVSGIDAGHGADFERDAALRLFEGRAGEVGGSIGALFNTQRWEEAQAGFKRIFDCFADWQRSPGEYEAARDGWWQAMARTGRGDLAADDDYLD